MASAAVAKTVPGRKGTCRLCFEEGGEDLIAPCACKGSSKWIHRECLNRWRTTGSNPRSLTNCCECGFQYELDLHRVMDSEGEERRRRFMRRLAGQGVGCFVGTQLVIILLGMIVRAIDSQEKLVKVFNFKQHEGQDGVSGDFINALQHHKTSYYVAGLLALLFILGVTTSFAACFVCCFKQWQWEPPWARPREDCCVEWCQACCIPRRTGFGYYRQPCMDCVDCARCCADTSNLCASGDCCVCGECCQNCSRSCGGNMKFDSDHRDIGAAIFIVIVVMIVIGLLAAIVAMVTTIQGALAKLAQLQQMRTLAAEYIVRDLADPSDLGDASVATQPKTEEMESASAPVKEAPPLAADPEYQQTVHMQINRDIEAIFSGSPQASQALQGYEDRSYGSTAV
eukprot:TRINITY_DN66994_c0_g1_i1.p1 TRINITY_DN66994_c0_g1~~TRINITY_DN66994_c0_g1_i1.p1  ORF type:complete len:398 (+),score=66.02 TRINITY_DN66994_c0_g1_i1:106-1299(+)